MAGSPFIDYFQILPSPHQAGPAAGAYWRGIQETLATLQPEFPPLDEVLPGLSGRVRLEPAAQDALLTSCYQRLLDALAEPPALAGLLDEWAAGFEAVGLPRDFELFKELAEAFSQALLPALDPPRRVWVAWAMQQAVEGVAEAEYRARVAELSTELPKQIFDELRQLPLSLYGEDKMPDLDEAELSLAAVLGEWGDLPADSNLPGDFEFLRLFAARLGRLYAAPQGWWELLLLKLDRVLYGRLGDALYHPLADALEVLIAAAPRLALLRDLRRRVWPEFMGSGLPVPPMLEVLILMRARPGNRLEWQLAKTLNAPLWMDRLEAEQQTLRHAYRQGLENLRPYWERAQLDWLGEAWAQLDNLCRQAPLKRRLLEESAEHCGQLAEALPGGPPDLPHALLGSAIDCIQVTDNPRLARDLWRYRIGLWFTPAGNEPVWTRAETLSADLNSLRFSESAVNELFSQIQPVLDTLGEIVRDSLGCSLPSHVAPPPGELLADPELPWRCLRQISLYRHLYDGYRVVSELKSWFAYHETPELADELLQILVDWPENLSPTLRETLDAWLMSLPTVAGARAVLPEAGHLARLAANHVLTTCPDYLQRVGEIGMRSCVRDNTFTLLRAAQVLGAPLEQPLDSLMWWWNTAVGSYLLNRDRAAMQANLGGLRDALFDKLGAEQAQAVFSLIQELYLQSLGVNWQPRETERGLNFTPLELHGPLWRKAFIGNRIPARPVALLQDMLSLSEPPGSGEQLPATTEALFQAQLREFVGSLVQYGEVEAAWQQIQPLLDNAQQSLGTQAVERAWSRLPHYLGRTVPWLHNAFWDEVIARGLEVIRQTGLGRQLQQRAGEFARLLAQRLPPLLRYGEIGHEHDESKCRRDLETLLDFMGECLRAQCPSLAALNLTRYLVENIGPFVGYPGWLWQMIWLQWQDILQPELDPAEQLALHTWSLQLEAVCARLPETAELGRQVFHHPEPIFAEIPSQEQHWRDTLGGLLAAALTPDDAPLPGTLLAQRLALSSPLLSEETSESWGQRRQALEQAFAERLPETLNQNLGARHQTLIATLSALEQAGEFYTLSGSDLAISLMSAHPWHPSLWRQGLLSKIMEEGFNQPLPADLFVTRHTGWTMFEIDSLRGVAGAYRAALDFREPLKNRPRLGARQWLSRDKGDNLLPQTQTEALRLLLRRLALLVNQPADAPAWRDLGLEMLSLFRRCEVDSPRRQDELLNSLLLAVQQQYGQRDPLGEVCRLARQHHPRLSLAARLLDSRNDLARSLVRQGQPFQQRESGERAEFMNRCARDLRFLLRRLGLHLAGMPTRETPATWHEQRIAHFLKAETREESHAFLARLETLLAQQCSREELTVMRPWLAELGNFSHDA